MFIFSIEVQKQKVGAQALYGGEGGGSSGKLEDGIMECKISDYDAPNHWELFTGNWHAQQDACQCGLIHDHDLNRLYI